MDRTSEPVRTVAPPHSRPATEWAPNRRAIPAAVFAPALGMLIVAAMLKPDPAGVGTHAQLGLPACQWLVMTDRPCPTCGMTTAFSHAAHGEMAAAFATQPAGAVLAIATAMAAILGAYAMLTGMSLKPIGKMLGRPWTFIGLGVVVAGGWAYTLGVQLGS